MNKYGVIDQNHIINTIRFVCSFFADSQRAEKLLYRTACAETGLGRTNDNTPNNGFGLYQIDRIMIEDLKQNSKHLTLFKLITGVDFRSLQGIDFAKNLLFATFACRMTYARKPERIPLELSDQAEYWKRYYNTELGKGTVDHFIKSVKKLD
jgi:hypothetical protein